MKVTIESENIEQVISDFDNIKKAIEDSGVPVPYDTDTREYGNKVRAVYAKGYDVGRGEVAALPKVEEVEF